MNNFFNTCSLKYEIKKDFIKNNINRKNVLIILLKMSDFISKIYILHSKWVIFSSKTEKKKYFIKNNIQKKK